MASRFRGESRNSELLGHQALGAFREVGDRHGQAVALNNLGALAEERGDNGGARALYEQSLALFHELGGPAGIGDALASLAWLAFRQGQFDRTKALAREVLLRNREVGDKLVDVLAVEALALSIGALGDPEWAMRLFAAAAAHRESAGIPSVAPAEQLCAQGLEAARTALGEAKSAKSWAEGRTMTIDRIIDRGQGNNHC